jgi:hypothetical protein
MHHLANPFLAPVCSYGLDLFLLSIDEGISGYRDDSLETVKRNEETYGIPLVVVRQVMDQDQPAPVPHVFQTCQDVQYANRHVSSCLLVMQLQAVVRLDHG